MQTIVGGSLIFVIGMLYYGLDQNYEKMQKRQMNESRRARQPKPVPAPGIKLLKINKIVGSEAWEIILGASQYYGVPADLLLTHWYLESGMQLGGDRGGAGGYFALAQIVKKQTAVDERHRWHRFVANERDLLAICDHCGYDCNAIRGSSTGALGPMQFQPSTWVLGAVDADGDDRACPLDLADGMFTAAKKIRNDYKRLGGWEKAILAYAGGNSATSYLRRAQRLRPIMKHYVSDYLNK